MGGPVKANPDKNRTHRTDAIYVDRERRQNNVPRIVHFRALTLPREMENWELPRLAANSDFTASTFVDCEDMGTYTSCYAMVGDNPGARRDVSRVCTQELATVMATSVLFCLIWLPTKLISAISREFG